MTRDDAISREAAINTVHKMRVVCDTEDIDDYYELLVESFKQLPSVTQKSGKWTLMYEPKNMAVCSECGKCAYMYRNKTSAFCPNCGARMESEE